MTNLVAPNASHEVAICKVCGSEFIKRSVKSTKRLGPRVRGIKAKTCSKKCSRIWANESREITNRRRKKEKLASRKIIIGEEP